MRRIFFSLFLAGILFLSSGCALFLIGAGAAGGYALSKDTARLEDDVSYSRAWSAVYKTIDSMGMIILADESAGKIEADVEDSRVIARVSNITKKAVRIDIKARKNLLPNIDLAVEIMNNVAQKL